MNILFIEDDEHKMARVRELILSEWPLYIVDIAKSVQEGLQIIRKTKLDLVLLDMSLPIFNYSANENGFKHSSYGGEDILDFMENYEINVPVIVITAFDRFGSDTNATTLNDLNTRYFKEYAQIFVGSVWYSSLEDVWQNELLRMIYDIKNAK